MEAIENKNPDQLRAIDDLRVKMEELAATGDLVAEKFNDVFAGQFGDAVEAFATNAKSLKDILKDLVKGIDQQISRIAANEIADKLVGKDGPLSFVGKGLSSLFGGKSASGRVVPRFLCNSRRKICARRVETPRPLRNLSFSRFGFDDQQLAFGVTFSDRSQAIFIASAQIAVSEPSSFALLAISLLPFGGFVARRR